MASTIDPTNRPRVQSVARAADVLHAVAASPDGLSPKEISEETGLPRQTVYHLIHTLVSVQLLRKGQGNRLVLGFAVGRLADAFQRQVAPQDYLRPFVTALAEQTGELAYASAWHQGELTVVAVARGARPIQAREVAVGNTQDGHARAAGKLLLALAGAFDRQQYLRTHRLTRRTPHTIIDRKNIERELEEIREQGFAIDLEEYEEGLCCLAVPLGTTPYVIGLSAPADRFRECGESYLQTALAVAREA